MKKSKAEGHPRCIKRKCKNVLKGGGVAPEQSIVFCAYTAILLYWPSSIPYCTWETLEEGKWLIEQDWEGGL